MSKKVNGNLNGLKSNQIRTLEKLYNKRLDQTEIINQDFARSMTEISREIKRQIAVLVNRKGEVDYVTVGDTHKVMLPDLKRQRVGSTRFRGLRCIHTHLSGENLTRDDLVDLTLLRLDLMSAITMDNDGFPVKVYSAYANPSTNDIEHPEPWILMEAKPPSQIDENFISLIESLEQESDNIKRGFKGGRTKEKAILIGVTTESLAEEEETMMELEELTKAANLIVLDKIIQKRKSIDAKYFLGKGKLQDIFIKSLSLNADVLIFNQSLNPSQIRSICKATDLKVIDRSMLILDIFSQRAKNKEGKVQVELAQLKYRLPRIVEKDDSLSRLTGGIGGRGPGETKLEENRRAIRKKISNLEKQTNTFRKQRSQKRSRRINNNLPIISLVGYTNAGKSTLLNSITKGNVETRKRMFETLAPTSRRLRLPKDEEVIINDTVGFIKDLPEDLLNAFKATLEEIQLSDIIIHIVDAYSPRFEKHIESVDKILAELNMAEIPRMIVFNKCDLIGDKKLNMLKKVYKDTQFISAKEKTGIIELLENIHKRLHLKIDAKVYQEAKKNEIATK